MVGLKNKGLTAIELLKQASEKLEVINADGFDISKLQDSISKIISNLKEPSDKEKIQEIKKWINNEDVFDWWADGNEIFEIYAEKLITKGIDIEFIKIMLNALYHAVFAEFVD